MYQYQSEECDMWYSPKVSSKFPGFNFINHDMNLPSLLHIKTKQPGHVYFKFSKVLHWNQLVLLDILLKWATGL